jgi:ribosomal protein L20A (L18A)
VTGLDRLDALDKVTRHLESEVAALRDRIRILEVTRGHRDPDAGDE